MMIRDSNGRIGVVIEDRGDCIFAVPFGVDETIDAIHPGVGRAKYMTATPWHKQLDGSYRGIWFDAPMHAPRLSASVAGDAKEHLIRYGRALYGNRWQSDLARALDVDDRRIRQWVAGDRRIPPGIWPDIADLLRKRQQQYAVLLRDFGQSD